MEGHGFFEIAVDGVSAGESGEVGVVFSGVAVVEGVGGEEVAEVAGEAVPVADLGALVALAIDGQAPGGIEVGGDDGFVAVDDLADAAEAVVEVEVSLAGHTAVVLEKHLAVSVDVGVADGLAVSIIWRR